MTGNNQIELRTLIKASAGSGKTFRLTDRFIYLLLKGASPESIIALTFSKKAAGEFFDAILCKLAEAAKNDEQRRRLEKEFGFSISTSDLRIKMSELLGAMNRLTLGTLDSFFFSILSSAPLEHGLAIGFNLLDEATEREKWLKTLRQTFEESVKESSGLIDAFTRATAEAEDRVFFSWMLDLGISFRNHFALSPDAKNWGSVDQLWPENSPWKQLAANYDHVKDCQNCLEWLENGTVIFEPELTESVKGKLSDALKEFLNYKPGSDLSKKGTIFKRLLKESMKNSRFMTITYRKDFQTSGEWVLALKRVSAYIIGEELKIYCTRTQGVYRLLEKVVNSYNQKVMEKGGITFSDLPILLSNSGDELERLNRNYRLDRKYEHWMLDEFQDTSPSQWQVIEPLLEEVLYDSEDSRMFFCVGDQKQAIYGWRGGDSRLFGHLEKKFSGRLEIEGMNESWRSGPDVLGVVNQVFGSKGDPEIMVPSWNRIWEDHIASPNTKDKTGNVAWWTSKDETEHLQAMVNLIKEVDPVGRGWSCAILTQKRKTAREIVDYIRRELPGVPVEEEVGSFPAKDNGFSQYLLSLLRAAIHPSDKWAIGHLKMCPFLDLDESEFDSILERVRNGVYELGFASFVIEWGEIAIHEVEEDAKDFVQKRMKELLSMAQTFDKKGERDIDLFIDYARRNQAGKGAMESSIRAMTIHGSKGLTFDMVIMPEIDGGSFRNTSGGGGQNGNGVDLYQRPAKSGIGFDWVLAKPKKIIQESDPFLSELLENDEETAAFENLCKFYVGMTRPARALYLFSKPPSPNSKSKNFIYLLNDTLSAGNEIGQEIIDQHNRLVGKRGSDFELAYCTGTPDWWIEKKKVNKAVGDQEGFKALNSTPRKFRNLSQKRPSEKELNEITVNELLEEKSNLGKDLGTEVHSLFEKLEWWDADGTNDWLKINKCEVSDKAVDLFLNTLKNQEILKLFIKPDHRTEVWNEYSFVFQKGDELIRGVFDRVVLNLSDDESIDSAEIVDFKTDRSESGVSLKEMADKHRAQLEFYRMALSQITGLKYQKIKMTLIFTSRQDLFSWV